MLRGDKNPEGENMQQKAIGITASIIVVLGMTIQALAETTPEDAFDYRKAVMTSLRGHIGAASMIARGLVEDGDIVSHAHGLANGAKELHKLFPAGSNVGETEALPVIWEKTEEFAAAISKAEEATAAFVTAAESGDKEAIGGAFRDVGMSCRGCHDDFRVAQD
jgi:cytochrome c556